MKLDSRSGSSSAVTSILNPSIIESSSASHERKKIRRGTPLFQPGSP